MLWYEILLIVAAAAFVLGIIVWQIIRKKQGKGGCDCGCSNCPSGCSCAKAKKQEPKK